MKKLLIASTALVASAGFASADVTLGGSANAGIKYNDGLETKKTRLHYEIDFDVIGSGTTDGGLTFGASVDLDAEIDSASGDESTNEVKDPEVFLSGDFGTITVGNLDVASDDIGMKDVGFDGIGIDNAIDNIIVIGTEDVPNTSEFKATANAKYEITVGGFNAIFAGHTIEEDYGIFLGYDGGAWNAAFASVTDSNTEGTSNTVRLGGVFGAWEANLYVGQHNNNTVELVDGLTYYGLDVEYVTGAYTITFAVSDTDFDDPVIGKDEVDFGIGVGYDLGGGAKLVGGLGYTDGLAGALFDAAANGESNLAADFGITLSF